MKRTRFLLSTLTAAALGLTFTGCDKKPIDPPKTPKATETTTTVVVDPTKPGQPGRTVEVKTTVSTPVVASAADVTKVAGAYGFLARLPKDVEGFTASYRLHDLWEGFSKSKWVATVLDLPPVKENADFTRIREQWNSEKGLQARELATAFLGNEFAIAMPAGFTAKLAPWVELLTVYQQTIIQAYFMMAMGGGSLDPAKMQQMIRDAAPQMIPALSKAEIPPFIMAFKAVKSRAVIDGALKQITDMVGTQLPPAFEGGQFKLADKYDFQSITLNAKKLVAQFQEEQLKLKLKELLGDEAKAKETLDAIVSKRVEIAWGWVDDYLVISLGSDHNHLKLAASAGESALAIGEVATRGGQFVAQKPHGLSYLSKGMLASLQGKMEFAESFKTFAEELQGILKPEQIAEMVADVRRLEAKAQPLLTNTFDSFVQVDVWEGGFRSELFGGAKHKAIDSSKPLTFGALATATSFFLGDGRANEAHSKATLDLMEDGAATLWGWYEKFGRTMVPENERQSAAMIEATAKPLVVDFWKATRRLGQGLGAESAFIIDLNGPMPKIQDLPPFLAEGKVPRIAWVAELKDRAAISEAWKTYHSTIKQVAALVGLPQPLPEPQMKQDGEIEMHFVQLPMPTDDLLPHVGITKNRWVLSTSPSFTKEIVAKAAAPAGMPMGTHVNVNFGALFDFADGWLKVVDKNAAQMFSPNDAQQYEQVRPLIDIGLKLARSLQGFEVHVHEESGVSRHSVRLRVKDLP